MAMRNHPSPDALLVAIRAKCLDCSGGMRKEVTGCKLKDCPLWPYRTAEARDKPKPAKGQVNIFEYMNQEKRA